MNTKLVSCLLVAVALAANGARAQTVSAATPALAVPAAASAAPLTPNQLVYSARLPGVKELTNIAAAQGLAIERIVQTPTQITAIYKYASGQTNTVAYLLLPNATSATGQVVAASPPPTVYYAPPPRVVYYDDFGPNYYYADRGYWYPPDSLSLGFGFRDGGGFHDEFDHGDHGGFDQGGHDGDRGGGHDGGDHGR